ncbi:MAG: PIN domain-containing protein [Deltaproteobacteria bacterium]|nr:PIN domain-containing protein [Deltaproteobacteria bacterium]
MPSLVLVDTCVFVDFLREISPLNGALRTLVREDRVILSPLVRLELLQGVREIERAKLASFLDGFIRLEGDEQLFKVAEELLPLARRGGLSFGLIDYLIVLQSLAANILLYTRDVTMLKLARKLDVNLYLHSRR